MPCVPALVRWMIVWPLKSTPETSNGEFPKSKSSGARPRISPIQIWPIPASRRARASWTVRTITILNAPFAKATAAVVKARKTSMTATVPVARFAPSRRLWTENFHNNPLQLTTFCPHLFGGGRKLVYMLVEQVNVHFHDGIPVHRIPFLIFQKEKLS